MRRRLMLFGAAAVVIAALVWVAGAAMTEPEGRRGLTAGVAVGLGFQLLLVAATSAAMPGKRLAAYGVGMLGRLLLVVVAALTVPATGLPPVPTLLSLVTVLFATTLLEPALFAAGADDEKGR